MTDERRRELECKAGASYVRLKKITVRSIDSALSDHVYYIHVVRSTVVNVFLFQAATDMDHSPLVWLATASTSTC